MAEELGEKTEMPTGRRRSQARNRGQVAKSPDFGSAMDLVGAFIVLLVMGASACAGLAAILRHLLDSGASGNGLNMAELLDTTTWTAARAAIILAPFLLAMFLVSFAAQFVQVGWLVSLHPLQPKFSKLNPLSGVARLVGRRNLVKTGLGVVKMTIVGAVAIAVIVRHKDEIAALALLELPAMLAATGGLVYDLCLWILAILLLIGITDLIYQRWQHLQDLKMTKQEVKDELRSMEGDIQTKGRRLRLARQMALQRLRQTVPTADVIVTNPTHFSVALKYDSDSMSAPRVVAKGADFLAFRIREIATIHRIPIVEKPPLARALYDSVPIGRQILPQFYEAVAEILAYVYRVNKSAA